MRTLGAGIAGGVLAGASVGAIEAIAVWLGAPGEGAPLAWGLVTYGLLGAGGGLAGGVVAAVLGTDAFALALAGVGAGLGFLVARFRIIRDVFLEQLPPGSLPTMVQLGAALVTAVLAIVLWRVLSGITARRSVVTRPLPVAGLVLVLAGIASVVGGLGPSARDASPESRGTPPLGAPNVVLIMIDTLRADRLSSYGAAVQTPAMDGLATDGVRFANAFAQASWTRPSVATILTGLYPSSHGAVHKADVLPGDVDTVAELLQRSGYRTVGFPNNVNVSAAFNFQQGFDEYRYLAPDLFFGADEAAAKLTFYSALRLVRERFLARRVDVENYYQPADVVTREVGAWLDEHGADQPFFMYVHFMDPHDPYMVHPFNGEGYARVADPNPSPERAALYARLYDAEVAYLDRHLGAMIEHLRARELYDRTLIVLTADHGEEFQEHGGWWHGTTLYDEQIWVPLVIKPPVGRGGGGRVVQELATTLDVVPTILAAAGVEAPPVLQGHALPLDGGPAPARPVVFAEEDLEGNVLQAVRSREWKLISSNAGNPRGLPPEQLFDVANDPGELRDLRADDVPRAEAMRRTLSSLAELAREHAGGSEQGVADAATLERLRQLGYITD